MFHFKGFQKNNRVGGFPYIKTAQSTNAKRNATLVKTEYSIFINSKAKQLVHLSC